MVLPLPVLRKGATKNHEPQSMPERFSPMILLDRPMVSKASDLARARILALLIANIKPV
jgi:hypothetical protein